MNIDGKRLKPITLVDQVENRIHEYIRINNLTKNDPIPNEKQLASSLNVSRSIVREALSRLRMLGIVESRTRRGMILQEPSIVGNLSKVVNPQLLGDENLYDLLGFRIALEIGITELIFHNITDKDIEELEAIINAQQSLGGNKLTSESELAFHSKLYEISQNKFILSFQKLILPLFSFLVENFDEFIPFNEKFSKSRKLIKHEDLLNSLKAGDKDGYRDGIIKHFESYIEFIKEKQRKEK